MEVGKQDCNLDNKQTTLYVHDLTVVYILRHSENELKPQTAVQTLFLFQCQIILNPFNQVSSVYQFAEFREPISQKFA